MSYYDSDVSELKAAFHGLNTALIAAIMRPADGYLASLIAGRVFAPNRYTRNILTGAFLAAADWGGQRGDQICIWGRGCNLQEFWMT